MLVPAIPVFIKILIYPIAHHLGYLRHILIYRCCYDSDCWQVIRCLWQKEDFAYHNDILTVGLSVAGFSTNIDFMLVAGGFQGVGLSMFPMHLVL